MIVRMGGKYEPLGVFLQSQSGDRVRLSFDQIERIINGSLPPSAGKHAVWWSNSRVEGRYNEVWLDRGWATADINMRARTVTFVREGPLRRSLRAVQPTTAAIVPAPAASLAPPPAAMHDIRFVFEWRALGVVSLDSGGRLAFPNVAALPGLYRIRISGGPILQVYIGESGNLLRRFGNYRNPGPSQQTNIRINQLLRERLVDRQEVAIDIVAGNIAITVNGALLPADLTSQAVRRMVEHAAIVASNGTDVELANRQDVSEIRTMPVEIVAADRGNGK